MITVNEESHPWREGLTVAQLIEEKRYTFKLLVTKIDGRLVKKSAREATTIPDGANVDVIHLMSGG